MRSYIYCASAKSATKEESKAHSLYRKASHWSGNTQTDMRGALSRFDDKLMRAYVAMHLIYATHKRLNMAATRVPAQHRNVGGW